MNDRTADAVIGTAVADAPAAGAAILTVARAVAPGLALVAATGGIGLAARGLIGGGVVSAPIAAILSGMAVRAVIGRPDWAAPGVAFAMRRLLRIAVALLGLQLTAAGIASIGVAGVGILAATLAATFAFTVWLGRRLGVEAGLAELIAAGTAVCGASAVAAVNAVTGARHEDVTYAIACVTIFGTLSMLLYPLLAGPLGLDSHGFGLWAGASIHEVAQVVAAAFQAGPDAGELGTVAKLTRVMMLAPLVSTLILLAARRRPEAGRSLPLTGLVPMFVVAFIVLALVNSTGVVPSALRHGAAELTTVLLTAALAAMGLETAPRRLAAKGMRPLALAAAAWVFIAGFSLALIEVVG